MIFDFTTIICENMLKDVILRIFLDDIRKNVHLMRKGYLITRFEKIKYKDSGVKIQILSMKFNVYKRLFV